MRYTLLVCLCALLAVSTGFAQKVKYKDLYVLLRVENYDDADKFLRIYLNQEPEDPHANYSMGRMLQSYLEKGDLLGSSERLLELADSSKLFYQRAYDLTTEKFVRKNDDDYYQDFRRRDMRTGKFEVKFSDVQYDIEQRIETVDKFESDLALLLDHFNSAQSFYQKCRDIYADLTERAPTENLLYFTTTTDDINLMRDITHLYDSSIFHLTTSRSLMKAMGESSINQQLAELDIESYPNDGQRNVDFYKETIEYVNYKAWCNNSIDVILKKIFPLKKRLITFDKRVKDLHDEVVRDSLDERDQVFRLATENVGRDLRDYDPNSLPAAIFNYRIAEINYHSAVHHYIRQVADTVDTGFKVDMLNDFVKQIAGVSKLVYKISDTNNPQQLKLYGEYVKERYESPEGLNQFIEEHKAEVRQDSIQVLAWLDEIKELDKIALWQGDSIALAAGVVKGPVEKSYTTILLDTLATRTIGFYAWYRASDSLALSFGVAPSSRQIDSLFYVPISQQVFDPTLPVPDFLVDTVGVGQRVWLLQADEMEVDSTFKIQIILTDYTLGPSWSREIAVTDRVAAIKKDLASNNLQVLGEGEKLLAVLDNYGQAVVDEAEEALDETEDKGDGEDQDNEGGGGR